MKVRFFRKSDSYIICKSNPDDRCSICINSEATTALALIGVAITKIAGELKCSPTDLLDKFYEGFEEKEKEPTEAGTSDGPNKQ